MNPEDSSPQVPAQPPTPASAPTQPSAPAPREPVRKSSTWKWVVGIITALTLCAFVSCGALIMFAAVPSQPFDDLALPTGENIGLIHITGAIAGGAGGGFSEFASPEMIIDQLDQAVEDPSVKAILLRIDSPGGTPAASQEIAMEVARAAEEKPVVVSVGDVAASGAYMIAAQSDEIIASPTSAIGSIGVIMQIPNYEELIDNIGVEFTVLTAGEQKDVGSPFRSITATEAAMLQAEVDVVYNEFIRMVVEGRGMSQEEVEELATGFAWSAVLAKDKGLVDSLGTYNDAVDRAAELGGIEGEPGIVTFGIEPYGPLMDMLFGISASLDRIGTLGQSLTAPTHQPLPR